MVFPWLQVVCSPYKLIRTRLKTPGGPTFFSLGSFVHSGFCPVNSRFLSFLDSQHLLLSAVKSTILCPGFTSLWCSPELLSRQCTVAITGLALFVYHLLRNTVLNCIISNALKCVVLHIVPIHVVVRAESVHSDALTLSWSYAYVS